MQEILTGVHIWTELSNERGIAFNGYAVATEQGTVVIDPPDPGESGWALLDPLGPFEGVYITNRNHSRAAATFRERYGAPVRIHRSDAGKAKVTADETLTGDESVTDEAIDDREELLRSAANLLDLEFDALLLCDGDPLLRRGKEKLRAFVYSHGKASKEEAS